MKKLPDMVVSVVIVSWNTQELLKKCLQSVRQYPSKQPLETWVVDNHSSDGSAEMVRREFPEVRLLVNEQDLGFAGANNQAITRAGGRYILLLNSDAELRPGTLDSLISALDANERLGMATPRLLFPDDHLQYSCVRSSTPWREFVHHLNLDRVLKGRRYPIDRWDLGRAHSVEVTQAACVLIRRAALEQIGLLDTGYFMYSEDDELCERLRKQGWDIQWCPQVTAIHHGGGSTRLLPREMFIRYYASKIRFYRRNRSAGASLRLKIALEVCSCLIVAVGFLAIPLPGKAARRMADIGRRFRPLIFALPSLSGEIDL